MFSDNFDKIFRLAIFQYFSEHRWELVLHFSEPFLIFWKYFNWMPTLKCLIVESLLWKWSSKKILQCKLGIFNNRSKWRAEKGEGLQYYERIWTCLGFDLKSLKLLLFLFVPYHGSLSTSLENIKILEVFRCFAGVYIKKSGAWNQPRQIY